jgi:hypothetical protein
MIIPVLNNNHDFNDSFGNLVRNGSHIMVTTTNGTIYDGILSGTGVDTRTNLLDVILINQINNVPVRLQTNEIDEIRLNTGVQSANILSGGKKKKTTKRSKTAKKKITKRSKTATKTIKRSKTATKTTKR